MGINVPWPYVRDKYAHIGGRPSMCGYSIVCSLGPFGLGIIAA